MGSAGKVVIEKGGEHLAPFVARALRSLPRGVREKLTKSPQEYKIVRDPANPTAAYSPLTGKVKLGAKAWEDPEIAIGSLTHEFQHAADIGTYAPTGREAAEAAAVRTEPLFVPYREAGPATETFEELGYSGRNVPLEFRAVSADKQVGPVYRRGASGQRLFESLGNLDQIRYPHLSEEASSRFVKLRQEESNALPKEKKERGALKKIRQQEELSMPGGFEKATQTEAEVQRVLREFEKARIRPTE
jgi:hypothetical protein